jgi:hypothetical protein
MSEQMYYYNIRLLIRHPTVSVDEVTNHLNMDPDIAWNAGDRNFTRSMVWQHTSWTQKNRNFFSELRDILEWLKKKEDFISQFLSTGGEFQVIINLPGNMNIGSELTPDIMKLVIKLGITIGVEVFPNMPKPD